MGAVVEIWLEYLIPFLQWDSRIVHWGNVKSHMSHDRSGSCIVVQGISKGQFLFRKALRKSGKSPVDFPGFLMAFLLIPYIVIFWAKFKPFLSYLIEYSRSLRTCSPRYQIIQYIIEYSSNLLDLLSFHIAEAWGLALLDTRLFNTL